MARSLTAPFLFKKRLPRDFGRAKILVTSRADIRLLAPDMEPSAADLFAVVRNYVAEGATVWDIGSNLGILSFCSALKTGRNGHVYSLEADSRYADIQSRTLKTSPEKAGNVFILCAAVADKQGILDLEIPKRGHARNHLNIVEGNDADETDMIKQVVTCTLDWLLDYWRPPDFVKIDVEGAELLAVAGGRTLFAEHRPIAYIECARANAEKMTRYFSNLEYRLFSLDSDGVERPIEKFVFNTIAKPAENCE